MNPHNCLVAVDPPGTRNRLWKCAHCGATGLFDQLWVSSCSHVYPPCSWCGQTPTCAPDCVGVAAALAAVRPPVGDA
jgi:hypothetical protein